MLASALAVNGVSMTDKKAAIGHCGFHAYLKLVARQCKSRRG
jgi:hypothetical protein